MEKSNRKHPNSFLLLHLQEYSTYRCHQHPMPSIKPTHQGEILKPNNNRNQISCSIPKKQTMVVPNGASIAGNRIMAVFDFDKTIIDCDSDDWVIGNFDITDVFDRLFPTMPLNSLMDRMMGEIHSRGKSINDIADCLKKLPLDPHIIASIKSAYALGCELRIVSDANVFFIKTILEHHKLIDYFTEINTNPNLIDEGGKLRIFPYHDLNTSPAHECPFCPHNMCKGMIMERIREEAFAKGETRFIYIGDGKGDYCPSLKLTELDYVMPRKNYPLWELICNNPLLIKAEIHGWTDAEDQELILLHLIEKLKSEDADDDLFPEFLTATSHDGLLEPFPVPN